MADIVPGTMVVMSITRRFGPYNVGDITSWTMEQGRELEGKRLARPLHLLVPSPHETPPPEGQEAAAAASLRQPAQVVRK